MPQLRRGPYSGNLGPCRRRAAHAGCGAVRSAGDPDPAPGRDSVIDAWISKLLETAHMPNMIEHRIPSSNSHPYILAFGPDGALWFCDNGAGQIGRMDLSTTKFHTFPLPRRDCQPIGIVTGPDGHLWFTEYAGHRVGRITVDGKVTEFNLPTTSAGPAGIIDGGDGNV